MSGPPERSVPQELRYQLGIDLELDESDVQWLEHELEWVAKARETVKRALEDHPHSAWQLKGN